MDLFGRLSLGREEFCQRLLTVLILGGEYPPWNTRSTPTPDGVRFLRALDELSFGESRCPDPPTFVDELELPPRHDAERGGAPDYALLWDDRVWLIELKTERGSHRVDQLPSYFRLTAHHYPGTAVDVTYLTPAMVKPPPPLAAGQRYAHLTWPEVVPLINDVWGDSQDAGVVRVRAGLIATLEGLAARASEWRTGYLAEPVELADPVHVALGEDEVAMTAARLTAADGKQRVVDVLIEDLQNLHDLRLHLRKLLAQDPAVSRVRPWVWSAKTSGGAALSAGGLEHGYELRVSRYEKAL